MPKSSVNFPLYVIISLARALSMICARARASKRRGFGTLVLFIDSALSMAVHVDPVFLIHSPQVPPGRREREMRNEEKIEWVELGGG